MLSTGVGGGGDVYKTDWDGVARTNPQCVGTAEDIAGLTIFLCSRAGAYTIGETICCDGGVAISANTNLAQKYLKTIFKSVRTHTTQLGLRLAHAGMTLNARWPQTFDAIKC